MAITLEAARRYIRSHIDKNKSGTIDDTIEGSKFMAWFTENTWHKNNFDEKAYSRINSIFQKVLAHMGDPLGPNGDGTFKGIAY